MTRLREALPDARFFCEEMNEQDDLDAEQLFIIDPIDGTMNFVHGFHHSCISVAYAERGVVRAGAIYNPYVDEMFTAISGQGARLNGRPIHAAEAVSMSAVKPPQRWISAVSRPAEQGCILSCSSASGTMLPES